MNDTTYVSSISLGVVDQGWLLAGACDLNGDSNADILWQNLFTGQRAIWIMNGIVYQYSVYLPPAPPG